MMAAKLGRGSSCTICQQRKLRCSNDKPCSNCLKAGVPEQCLVAPLQAPRRRKRKPDEQELLRRLERYEGLLAKHGIDLEVDQEDQDVPDAQPTDAVSQSGGDTFISSTINSIIKNSSAGSWQMYPSEYKHAATLVTSDPNDPEQEPSLLFQSFATRAALDPSHHLHFAVIGESSHVSLTERHPATVRIFQLWQTYLNNVDPLLRITHTPSLQKQLIASTADISQMSKPMEALMFAVYLAALISLSPDEVHDSMGETKAQLLKPYHASAQQALINARYMSSSDLVVLQAQVLYLISIREFVDPRSHSCLIGVAVRVAQRLGLHRDGTRSKDMPPLDIEQRRRLWWNLVALDKRIAELSGTTVSAFSTTLNDCQRPSNINDSDLHASARVVPKQSDSTTEMVFALARYELATAADPNPIRPLPTRPYAKDSSDGLLRPKLLNHFQGYSDYVEDAFLKKCDPNIPLHLFTQMTTRQSICKLNILSNIRRIAERPASIPQEDRKWLLMEAIRMMEADNAVQADIGCRGFLWYAQVHSPFPAYMIFAQELRDASDPAICARAWAALEENYRYRGLIRALQPPMHIGFTTLFLEAWNAWEVVQTRRGQILAPSKFIEKLRELMAVAANTRRLPETSSVTAGDQPASSLAATTTTTEVTAAAHTWAGSLQQPFDQSAGFDDALLDWSTFFPQQFSFDPNLEYVGDIGEN